MKPIRALLISNASKASYRYWRFVANAWTSPAPGGPSDLVRVAEWQLITPGAVVNPTAPMTTDSAPSPLMSSALSTLGAGFEAFRAFDGDLSDSGRWISAPGPSAGVWLQIDFGASGAIRPTSTKIAPDGGVAVPPNGNYLQAFNILASNTGSFAGEEVTFLSVSGLLLADWTANTLKTFALLDP